MLRPRLLEESLNGPMRKISAPVSVSTPRYSITPVVMSHAASTQMLGWIGPRTPSGVSPNLDP